MGTRAREIVIPPINARWFALAWIPTLAAFVTSLPTELNPKRIAGFSFNREVLEGLSPPSQQVWLGVSIGGSRRDRRKDGPRRRRGRGSPFSPSLAICWPRSDP